MKWSQSTYSDYALKLDEGGVRLKLTLKRRKKVMKVLIGEETKKSYAKIFFDLYLFDYDIRSIF